MKTIPILAQRNALARWLRLYRKAKRLNDALVMAECEERIEYWRGELHADSRRDSVESGQEQGND